MNILDEIRRRFATALAPLTDECEPLLDMIRRSQDPKFGDYQANCAMPLGKQLGRSPKGVAADLVAGLKLDDLCELPEIAGPGFINLRLKDAFVLDRLQSMVGDERLGVSPAAEPRTYVIDYSAPNVAKPMHVGHIRSTVIGDSLCRTLRFLGHKAIGDNHVGDWGTQFGMIIYGYKHFLGQQAFEENRVAELARLYKLVNRLIEYHDGRRKLPELKENVVQQKAALTACETAEEAAKTQDPKAAKKAGKDTRRQRARLEEAEKSVADLESKLQAVDDDAAFSQLAAAHEGISGDVLNETAKLHSGDEENVRLWNDFVPACMEQIDSLYRRIDVKFDETLGESFYHDRLAAVVEDLTARGIAEESDGAICVFFPDDPAPMIVQKRDGAFLYATTDLATIQYRMERWRPSAILYVVDHRQSLHFEHLFTTVRAWGFEGVELQHVSFGTVLGEDNRPFKTRTGVAVGLGNVLDEAVAHALKVVSQNDDAKPTGAELSPAQRENISEVVGIGAIKYADLSHNRTSDYVFSYEKMMATTGNTATYMQYSYARVQSIFRRGKVDIAALRQRGAAIEISDPHERALAVELIRLPEALADVVADYRPNQLTNYLFDQLGKRFSDFFEHCPVLKADTNASRDSRLLLCDLTARTLKQGLDLLGIDVVEQM